MPTPFTFSILSPRGQAFAGPVVSMHAPGQAGGFSIFARHAPMMAAVVSGVTTVRDGQHTIFYYTGEGVVEVSHHEVIMLVDEAERVEKVEEALDMVQQRRNKLDAATTAAKGKT